MSLEKGSSPYSLPEAIDLSHHLSILSRSRLESPLKGLQRFFGKPGMLSLAGGLPSTEYFPFEALKADVQPYDSFAVKPESAAQGGPLSWIWNLFGSKKDTTIPITVPKYPEHEGDVNLAVALQYGLSKGLPQLQAIINEFSSKVYRPAYANFTTILHAGNTDGWMKAVTTLCNPGEGVLTSEWTYPSALATMHPFGIRAVPVGMDSEGMSSESLSQVLSGWDEVARSMPRPHVMYIVPVGQNPTGATMGAARKKAIYEICVKYDVIIVEDDPYYFLQEGPYVHPSLRSSRVKHTQLTDEEYIANLAPSFLRFDYQGRVVRLDTFSKTIAPGSRLGWFTCNALFAERLERQAETSTQAPCGFGQSLITQLLLNWKFSGYLRWLKGLGVQYTDRRDYFIDCLVDKFHLELAPAAQFGGSMRYTAYDLTTPYSEKAKKKPLFSFVPPSSGMFIWLQLHLEDHPQFKTLGQETLEMQLWVALAEGGVLFGPGNMFSADRSGDEASKPGHFRISFSNAEFADLKKAVDIFAKVLYKFYNKSH
ncbi:PLP-dependent transferase [Agrocybe pediades]|nr:PLP-dependent transferase [Agrocybe pediades]